MDCDPLPLAATRKSFMSLVPLRIILSMVGAAMIESFAIYLHPCVSSLLRTIHASPEPEV